MYTIILYSSVCTIPTGGTWNNTNSSSLRVTTTSELLTLVPMPRSSPAPPPPSTPLFLSLSLLLSCSLFPLLSCSLSLFHLILFSQRAAKEEIHKDLAGILERHVHGHVSPTTPPHLHELEHKMHSPLSRARHRDFEDCDMDTSWPLCHELKENRDMCVWGLRGEFLQGGGGGMGRMGGQGLRGELEREPIDASLVLLAEDLRFARAMRVRMCVCVCLSVCACACVRACVRVERERERE
jgi:hypothetical protein